MATIWKYPVTGETTVHEVPKGAAPLHMGADPEGNLCVWFVVNPDLPKEKRAIIVVGTGHSVPDDAAKAYVGTFVSGRFVNHVFAPPADHVAMPVFAATVN